MALMRPSRRAWLWLLATALILGSSAGAPAVAKEKAKAPHKVSVELISELDGIEPGAPSGSDCGGASRPAGISTGRILPRPCLALLRV